MSASAPSNVAVSVARRPLKWRAQGDVDSPVTGVFGLGRDLFVAGPQTVRRSTDAGAHWTVADGPGGNAIWGASIDELWLAGPGLSRSTDHGVTWAATTAPFAIMQFVGGRSDDVITGGISSLVRSKDHGATWTPIQHGIPMATFYAVATLGTVVLVVGREQVTDPSSPIGYHTESIILRSPDGATFTRLVAPKPGMTSNEESRGICFTASGKMFLAMSYSVYASTDLGATWTRAADVGTEVLGLACRDREIMISARNKGFSRSSDDGATFDTHALDGILGPELIALQSVWIGADGTALVAGESYTNGGTLLVRAR